MGTTRTSCMIMFILAGAAFLTKTMAFTGIPRALAEWVEHMHLSPYMLIAALTVVYLVLGTVVVALLKRQVFASREPALPATAAAPAPA